MAIEVGSTIFLSPDQYCQAWDNVQRAVGASGEKRLLLASLVSIKNNLIGNKGRKLDAVRNIDLQPLFTAINCPVESEEQEELVLRIRTEAATIASLLCFPHEHSVRAIVASSFDASLLSTLLASLTSLFPSHAFADPSDPSLILSTLASLHPRRLALLKALLRALSSFLSALRDVAGPRTWGGMTRAPEKVHRARSRPVSSTTQNGKAPTNMTVKGKAKGKAVAKPPPTDYPAQIPIDPLANFTWTVSERRWQVESSDALVARFLATPICTLLLPAVLTLRPSNPSDSSSTSSPSTFSHPPALNSAFIPDLVLPTLQTISSSFVYLPSSAPDLRRFVATRFMPLLSFWIGFAHNPCAESAMQALNSVAVGCGLVESKVIEGGMGVWGGVEAEEGGVEATRGMVWEVVEGQRGRMRRRGPGWAVARRFADVDARIRAAAASTMVSLVANRIREPFPDAARKPPGPGPSTDTSALDPVVETVLRRLLTSIMGLLEEPDVYVRAQAAYTLAHYTSGSETWQVAAHKAGVMTALKQLLEQAAAKAEPYPSAAVAAEKAMLRESALLAIASLVSAADEPRSAVISQGILPSIVSALTDPSAPVRAAACQCCRALSRATSILRTSLLEEGAGPKLFDLIVESDAMNEGERSGEEESEDDVRTVAMAAVCNLVLEFSPMKQELLDRGVVEKMVHFTNTGKPQLRRFALFGLKNMAFSAAPELKAEIASALGWERIARLVEDPDLSVQEHTFSLLRNFAYGKIPDVDLLVAGLGGPRLVSILENVLHQYYSGALAAKAFGASAGAAARGTVVAGQAVVEHTLYVMGNVATGLEKHKMLIAESSDLLRLVTRLLMDPNPGIRIAASWCVLNLVHREGGKRSPAALALRTLGIEQLLKTLKEDENLDVRERARDALDQLDGRSPTDF